MRLIAACLTIFACPCFTPTAADPPQKIKPIMVWSGIDSGCAKESFARSTSQDEWRKTWKLHSVEGGDAGRRTPDVDFDSYMVLSLFDGEGSQNHGVVLIEIINEANCLRVRYAVPLYQTGEIPDSEDAKLRLATRSYAFVILPRSDKTIIFEEGQPHREGGGEVTYKDWKEKGRSAAVKPK
jgi:hypothetical protein